MLQEFISLPWARIFLLFLLFYFLLVVFAWVYADRILFPHPSDPTYSSSEVDFYALTEDGSKIPCIHIKAANPNGMTILYSHGNGEDLGMIRTRLKEISKFGCNIIAYDYPGYGLHSGKPTEEGCYQAIVCVYEHILSQFGVSNESIIAWGRSLGTGPSCYLTSIRNVGGVILESPFLTAFRSVTEIQILPWDRFRNIEHVKNIKSPTLIIHGRWDEVVPFRHGKKLYSQFENNKEFLEIKNASHNDISEKGGKLYKETIIKFINSLL